MKITGMHTIVVGNPWKNWLFVKLTTDEGITGLGECTYGLGTRAVEAMLEEIRDLVIGEDPTQIEGLGDRWRKALFLVHGPIISAALSGLNIACWDIAAKAAGLPLYRLLGGRTRPRIRAYANGWYQGPREPSFFAERAAEVVAMGYTALKFDPFGHAYQFLEPAEEKKSLAIVAAVRAAVGDETDLMIEAHDRFSVATAIRIGRLLEAYHPMWFETPVLSYDIAATLEVARAIPVPVASGERFTALQQVSELLQGRIVSFVQPETLRIGGVSGLLEAGAVARSYGAWLAPHSAQSPFTTAVNAHLGAAIPNVLIQECFDDFHIAWARDVLSGCPQVVQGYLQPGEQAGIGVELDELEAARHPYSPKHRLRLFEAGWEWRGSQPT
ncbi:MAG: mandelate racemase/muconate lactonizing enzyme family protein [Clostridiaceae bacterium]|nr:mandelate racemase/muconate lactonizing enzyme family protein [Clostridiaceae bacterium]